MKKICLLMAAVLLFALIPFGGCKTQTVARTVYDISAVFDGERSISADMRVNYVNDTDTEINCLKFNLHPSAFREGAKNSPCAPQSQANAYPNGLSYGGIEIKNCKISGDKTEFKICGSDENILEIPLKNGVFPNERAEIEIDFNLTLAECTLRLGAINGYVNLGNWYPVLCVHTEGGFKECEYSSVGDPFFSAVADYKVKLTVPGEYTVAAGGICLSTEINGGNTTYSYALENARDFAASLSKDFSVKSGKAGDTDVYYYFVNQNYADEIIAAAVKAVNYFSAVFGEYPYTSLAVVSTAFLQGGMEFPSLVYISDALDKEGAITAAVHETAHQWWYAAVGNDQTECAYIDEGLAEYSTLLFYENHPEYSVTREEYIQNKIDEFHSFYGVFTQLTGKADTRMGRKLSEFSGEFEYVMICYVKSALMFDGYRQSVGDKKFFKGLKRFYNDNKFGIAGTDELIAAFNFVGCDCEGYFNSWLSGTAII